MEILPRLHGEGFIQKLLVKMLLLFLNKNCSDPLIIKLWPSCSTDHLQYIGNWKVDVAPGLSIEELCPFDNDEVCRKIDAPCKSTGCNQHLKYSKLNILMFSR